MSQTTTSTFELVESSPIVEDELGVLTGLGPASFANLQRLGLRDQSGSLRIADLLRGRADGTIGLVPTVRRWLSNRYVDRLLDDALALLDAPARDPGYFHPTYNLRARQHGGACGIEGVKPAHHYPQNLLDAMADLRGDHIITNIGQSGCFSCSIPAINQLRDALNDEGQTVIGRGGFSAQANPEHPIIRYESFADAGLTTRELGQRITATLDAHDVPSEWNGEPDTTIQTYPDAQVRHYTY